MVYGKANISNLTPAYNLITTKISASGNGAETFDGYLNYQEALDGVYNYMLAYMASDSAEGNIKVKVKVRMGGTDIVKVKTGSFTVK